MDAVTAGFADRIQAFERSRAVETASYSAHKIMLCRNDGNGLSEHVVPFLSALFRYRGEVTFHLFFRNRTQIEPDVLRAVLFHLFQYIRRHHVARLQLVAEAVEILIEKTSALAPDRFGNEKAPPRFFGIQRSGVYLDIVDIVHRDAVLQADGDAVARQYSEIGRLFENTAYTSARKYRVIGVNLFYAVPVLYHYSEALVPVLYNIEHNGFGSDFNVFKRLHLFH